MGELINETDKRNAKILNYGSYARKQNRLNDTEYY